MSVAADRRVLEACFADASELRRVHEAELRHGGLLLRGADGLEERERVTLRLRHPEGRASLELAAEVVWIGDAGVGLHLLDEEGSLQERLRAFVEEPPPPSEDEQRPSGALAITAFLVVAILVSWFGMYALNVVRN